MGLIAGIARSNGLGDMGLIAGIARSNGFGDMGLIAGIARSNRFGDPLLERAMPAMRAASTPA